MLRKDAACNAFRDVAFLGPCDDGCGQLGRELGWGGEWL